jgi:hypothetical protein
LKPNAVHELETLFDVPPATVNRLFSSKRGIVKALLDISIAGDDEAVPVADRSPVRSLLGDSDPTWWCRHLSQCHDYKDRPS